MVISLDLVRVIVAAVAATAPAPAPAPQSITDTIPDALAKRLAGCWQLGRYERVVVRAIDGHRMTAEDHVEDGPRGPRSATEPLRYDADHDVVGFQALPSHHSRVVRLELRGNVVTYDSSSKISGKWDVMRSGTATRCR